MVRSKVPGKVVAFEVVATAALFHPKLVELFEQHGAGFELRDLQGAAVTVDDVSHSPKEDVRIGHWQARQDSFHKRGEALLGDVVGG